MPLSRSLMPSVAIVIDATLPRDELKEAISFDYRCPYGVLSELLLRTQCSSGPEILFQILIPVEHLS